MSSALVKGIWKERKDLLVHTYTPSFSRAEKLAMETSGTAYKNPSDIPKVDAYLIGCKPQQFDQLAMEFKDKIGKDKIIISILAGVKADRISEKLGNRKVVRIMPNTPTLVSKGVSLLYSSEYMDIDEKREVEDLISKTSKVYSFEDEEMIEKLSGLTGSGPAYVFELARILQRRPFHLEWEKKTLIPWSKDLFMDRLY